MSAEPAPAAAPDSLSVWLRGEPLGELRDFGFGRVRVEFAEEALLRYGAGSLVLSLSLPVQLDAVDVGLASNFFRGLLPEGAALERIAQQLRVSDNDCYALLAALGRDCAGALVLLPPGEPPNGAEGSIEWLDDQELERRLDALPVAPLGFELGGRVRLSLAGAQDKLVVFIGEDGGIGLPLGGRPSTHILKPPSTRRDRRGQLLYPDLVANEAFCMRLATLAGIDVAQVEVRTIGALRTLVVVRFDRARVGDSVVRIHQEDACQALGIDPLHKYEQHGGPGLAQIAELLREHAATPIADILRLLELATFNVLIGNTDAHGKNTSLLHLEHGGVTLAPAYDLVSTAAYPHHDSRLATSVGGARELAEVDADAIERLYAACGVPPTTARRRFAGVLEAVSGALPEAVESARREACHAPVVDEIARLVESRIAVLSAPPRGT